MKEKSECQHTLFNKNRKTKLKDINLNKKVTRKLIQGGFAPFGLTTS